MVKNVMIKKDKNMNNKGLSLVELLVALAVSTIIITGIAYLIITSLHLYGKTNANAEIQNEVQTAMNIVVDYVMQSEGICMRIEPSGQNISSILLGKLIVQDNGIGGYIAYYHGNAIVYQREDEDTGKFIGQMYLLEIPNTDLVKSNIEIEGEEYAKLSEGEPTEERAVQKALEKVENTVIRKTISERTKWLMARFVTACEIYPLREEDLKKETIIYSPSDIVENYYFQEPFVLSVDLSFAYPYDKKMIKRELSDDISVRNRMKKIFIEKDDVMNTYKLKK